LIGAAAISALPPLNGFASEWLTFQAVFLSPTLPQWGLRFLAPAAGAMLALAAALAAACFVKAFGVTFLGRPRTQEAEQARETDALSLAAMFGLAALCVVAGIVPGLFINVLSPVSRLLTASEMPHQVLLSAPLLPTAGNPNSYSGLMVALLLVLALTTIALAVRAFANMSTRRARAWDCGYPDASRRTQYSAESFAEPIRRVFGTLVFSAREEVTMPPPGDLAPAEISVRLRDPAWDFLYAPPIAAVGFIADRLNVLQFLTIRRYLTLVFFALIILLTVLALWV
jgi:NADH:ubiquinone oxidoreductase subunit 5 (subunit L)/multisubunit Na+/H+ antiporter MnhA subunit